jgi:uncharacterized protein (DUF1778 family)
MEGYTVTPAKIFYTEPDAFVRGPNKTKQLRLRLTPDEYKEAMAAARSEGLTLAQFVRLAMKDRKMTVEMRQKDARKK